MSSGRWQTPTPYLRTHAAGGLRMHRGGLLGLEIAGRSPAAVSTSRFWIRPLAPLPTAGAKRLRASRIHLNGNRHRDPGPGVRTAEIAGDESVRAVVLGDGTGGSRRSRRARGRRRPNAGLARSAGLAVNRALVVDEGMRTERSPGVGGRRRRRISRRQLGALDGGPGTGKAGGARPGRRRWEPSGTPPATQLQGACLACLQHGALRTSNSRGSRRRTGDATRLVRVVLRNDVVVGGNLIADATLAGALRAR